jgi:SAM-dependent methyltransferase
MSSHITQAKASAWVQRFASHIPQGLVLDCASGGGRHARLFAELGHSVLACDRDAAALATIQHPLITCVQCDLETEDAANHVNWPFAPHRFAGIVVTNYLHRPLFTAMLDSLVPGGVLIVETFALGNAQFGKPSNPDFLLTHGELTTIVQAAKDFHVLAYEDGYISQPKPAMVQRICAIKRPEMLQPVQLSLD